MEKVLLDFSINDTNLYPLIEAFLNYKYEGCYFRYRDNVPSIIGKDKRIIVDAVNDVRKLVMLCVGDINK